MGAVYILLPKLVNYWHLAGSAYPKVAKNGWITKNISRMKGYQKKVLDHKSDNLWFIKQKVSIFFSV